MIYYRRKQKISQSYWRLFSIFSFYRNLKLENESELLTDATVFRRKPSVPSSDLVVGVDICGSGVTCGLQIMIKTFVHHIVVPTNAKHVFQLQKYNGSLYISLKTKSKILV